MSHPVQRTSLRARVSAAIVEAAGSVIAARGPEANMAEVADAAGVARATLYRYFPTRESLLEAVSAVAAERARDALAEARLDQVTVDEGVARAVRALLSVGDHFVVLARERGGDRDLDQPVTAPLRSLVERGQESGEIRGDVPAAWLTDALVGMVLTAAVAAGPMGPEDIVHAVTGLFLDGARSSAAR